MRQTRHIDVFPVGTDCDPGGCRSDRNGGDHGLGGGIDYEDLVVTRHVGTSPIRRNYDTGDTIFGHGNPRDDCVAGGIENCDKARLVSETASYRDEDIPIRGTHDAAREAPQRDRRHDTDTAVDVNYRDGIEDCIRDVRDWQWTRHLGYLHSRAARAGRATPVNRRRSVHASACTLVTYSIC